MKTKLLYACLFVSFFGFSQIQVLTSNTDTNHLVYDATTNRIYASIPSSNGINGMSIGEINPNTSTLENTTFIGDNPTILAISDDGAYIYAGFDTSNVVRRFDIANETIFDIDLGTDGTTGDYYAEDIEVMPGASTTIAVSRKNDGTPSQRFEGVVIFDGATARANVISDNDITNVIEFADNSTVYGINNETSDVDVQELSVDANGVSVSNTTDNIISEEGADFTFNNDILYTTGGNIVDVSGNPTFLGQFSDANGPVIYDSEFDLVCYASFDGSGVITFKRYDPNTFLLVDDTDIAQAIGEVKSLTKCGSGCYSFNTADKVVIVRNLLLGVTEFMEETDFTIYPNPANNYINIKSYGNLKSAEILDINGRVVRQSSNLDNQINISTLSEGMYIVRITDFQNQILTKKLIKR